MKRLRNFLVALPLISVLFFATDFKLPLIGGITNPYYLSTPGTALLVTDKIITGKFYYSSPPFSNKDVFYFYRSNPGSLQKIPVSQIKRITFKTKAAKQYTYVRHAGKLKRTLPNGTRETLNTQVLRNLK